MNTDGQTSAEQRNDREIAELWKTGLSYPQIADQLGTTISVVSHSVGHQLADGRLARRRLPRRTPEQIARDDAAILALREEGLTHQAVATRLALSLGAVSGAVNRARARHDLGEDLGLTPEVTDELVTLWRAGQTQAQIAQRQHATESLTNERIKLLRARGVDLRRRRSPTRWTRDTIIQALRDWTEKHGRPPTCRDWTQADPTHPSYLTVRRHFQGHGSWVAALSAASDRVSP